MTARSLQSMRARKVRARSALRESAVEDRLVERCRDAGFLPMKFTSPARGGVPDRLLVTPVGTLFVELKRPTTKPDPRQAATHEKLRSFGGEVHVVSTLDEVDALIDGLLSRTSDPPTKDDASP